MAYFELGRQIAGYTGDLFLRGIGVREFQRVLEQRNAPPDPDDLNTTIYDSPPLCEAAMIVVGINIAPNLVKSYSRGMDGLEDPSTLRFLGGTALDVLSLAVPAVYTFSFGGDPYLAIGGKIAYNYVAEIIPDVLRSVRPKKAEIQPITKERPRLWRVK